MGERRFIAQNKPSTQAFIRAFSEGVWGGVSDEASQTSATIVDYPNRIPGQDLGYGVVKMPYSYWQKGMDSYAQLMQIVDDQIGRVLDALGSLPPAVVENTVIVSCSDHGEYSGAHGLAQGKMGSVYEEAWHVPLIVVDPSRRLTGDDEHVAKIRMGLTSSVDFMSLIVSLPYRGAHDWMRGPLEQIYGNRHDMISMLKSADAPGRLYVLLATDEVVPNFFVFKYCGNGRANARVPPQARQGSGSE